MKKSILARGFIGSVASLLGVVAMGCSGEVMDEATAGNGEIGSVEQAIGIDNLNDSAYDAVHLAAIKLDSSRVLVTGGYSNTGLTTAISTSKIYDSSNDSWVVAGLNGAGADTSMRARAEHGILLIPGTDKILVYGGKASGAFLNTSDIYDISEDKWTAVTDTMDFGVARSAVVPCGTGSELLVLGGLKNNSGTPIATDDLQVFTFGSGDGANSTWDVLKNGGTTVKLTTPSAYLAAIPLADPNHIMVIGGETAGLTPLDDVERINVSNTCDTATKTDLQDLPVATSRFVAAPVSPAGVGGEDVRVFVAGGITTGNAYLYDETENDWDQTTNSMTARSEAVITVVASNKLAVSGGLDAFGDTVTTVEEFTLPATTTDVGGTWATPYGAMDDARFGHWAAFLDRGASTDTLMVGHGLNISSGTPSFLSGALRLPE